MTPPLRVAVVCTDRGTHPSRRLGWPLIDHRAVPFIAGNGDVFCGFLPTEPHSQGWGKTGRVYTTSDMHIVQGSRGFTRTHQFLCRTCGRDTQLSDELLGHIVDAFHANNGGDNVRLDISQLPF